VCSQQEGGAAQCRDPAAVNGVQCRVRRRGDIASLLVRQGRAGGEYGVVQASIASVGRRGRTQNRTALWPSGDAGSAEDDLRVVMPRRRGVPGRFILGHGLPARGFQHLAAVLQLPPHPERSKQFGFQSVLLQLSQVLNGKVLGADLTANLARV